MFAFFDSGVLIGFWQNEKTDFKFIHDTHLFFNSVGRNCANITCYWYEGLNYIPANKSFDSSFNLTDTDTSAIFTASQVLQDPIPEQPAINT